MPQIYDMGPTAVLPLRRKACWGFFHPKNPTASAGFEPANLGTKGQHAAPRPPKPLVYEIMWKNMAKPERPQMTIRLFAIFITEATSTHSEYVIDISQKLLHEPA